MKSKIRIMKTRPDVTEHEINSLMDFDALLKKKDQVLSRRRRNNRWRNVSVTIIGIGLLTALTVVMSRRQDVLPESSSQLKEISQPLTSAKIDSAQSDAGNSEENADAPVKYLKKDPQPSHQAQPNTSPPSGNDSSEPEPSGYVQPEPVDGYPALYSYFDTALQYPAAAVKDSIEGIVTVAFVIDVKGEATKVTVENSLGEVFDAEVRRLVLHMPPWRPATYDGKPVESKVSLPITFSLNRNTNR